MFPGPALEGRRRPRGGRPRGRGKPCWRCHRHRRDGNQFDVVLPHPVGCFRRPAGEGAGAALGGLTVEQPSSPPTPAPPCRVCASLSDSRQSMSFVRARGMQVRRAIVWNQGRIRSRAAAIGETRPRRRQSRAASLARRSSLKTCGAARPGSRTSALGRSQRRSADAALRRPAARTMHRQRVPPRPGHQHARRSPVVWACDRLGRKRREPFERQR